MLLYVYDKSIALLGVIEEITSLVWTEKKYTYGTFEMLLPATAANIELIQKNKLIIKDDDTTHIAGEILYIKINKSADGREKIEVTGKLLSHWLADRILLPTIAETTQKPQQLMRKAVTDNAINSTVTARNYPLLTLGTMLETRPQAALNFKNEAYTTVLAMCEELASAEDTGFNIGVDIPSKRFRFNTYTGADHTINSASPCIFSVEYENILEQEYTQSVENLKNVAYITGEEKSTAAMPKDIGAAAGHDRKEVYINASSIRQETLTNPQYLAVLAAHGELVLEQYAEALNFYNRINAATSGFIYGVDYTLGDKVTCINTAWKVAIDAVITEAQTTYEDGQKTIFLTFGKALPTLFNKIKNLIKR